MYHRPIFKHFWANVGFFLVSVGVILISVVANGQTKEVDSLQTQRLRYMRSPEQMNTTDYVDLLINLAGGFQSFAPDSARYFALEALRRSERLEYPQGVVKAKNRLGVFFDLDGQAEIAIKTYQEALQLANQIGFDTYIGHLYNNLGIVYDNQGNYKEAVRHYLHAVRQWKTQKNILEEVTVYNNLAHVYFVQQNYVESIRYLEEALAISKANQAGTLINDALNNLALVHEQSGDFEEAETYLRESLLAAQEIKDQWGIIYTLTNLGELKIRQKEYETALNYFREAETENRTLSDKSNQSYTLQGIAEVYFLQGKSEASITAARASLQIATEIQQLEYIKNSHQKLYQAFEQLGWLDSALFHHKKFKSYTDSLKVAESEKQLQELQTQYETEKKEVQILQLQNENQSQELALRRRQTVMSVGGVSLLSIIAFGTFWYRQYIRKKQHEADHLKQKLLRIQLNPHFMYNSLSAIQHLIYQEKDRQRAADYLARFARLMRQILELNQQEQISLDEELAFIENYLHIQQLRFDHPFTYELEISEELDFVSLPPMITQPFIENAIEHGIMHKQGRGHLYISFQLKGKSQLEICIEDDGVGREQAAFLKKAQKHRSLATQITRERLALLEQKSGIQVGLRLEDRFKENLICGTKVNILIPIFENL